MAIQLTIIGLGQIGSSIGLSLAKHSDQVTRLGSDIDRKVMVEAQKLGAVDRTTSNLNEAVRNADMVILAIPLDQVGEMMEAIAPAMKDEAVLVDTSPIKSKVIEWVDEFLPSRCSYVGVTPVLGPNYLHNDGYGIAAANADLFVDGLFGIITPKQSNAQAVELITDLIQLMGANPLFIDLYENDGLMATTHVLPQFVSIALLNATLNKPGWNEARKVAGRAFAEASGPAAHLDDAEALGSAAKHNQENVVRKLDDVIYALQELRQVISQDNTDELIRKLKGAKAGVNQWWIERGRGDWSAEEMPSPEELSAHASILGNLFGFDPKRRKRRNRE